jgi:phosphoribosyl 1,2-cyclic phosphodiesterase
MHLMSLQITSLASGSSGNAFLVQTTTGTMLVEAGLAARTLDRHMRRRGVDPSQLDAIVISHEHHDHVQGAATLARKYGLPIIASVGTATAMREEWKGLDVRILDTEGLTIGGADLYGFPVPHDAVEPQGILLSHAGHTAAWALDLGHVPEHVAPILQQADLIVVEANHDRERLIKQAPYAWSVKNRILSKTGHLSNLQAAELLQQVGSDQRARSVWLAHLSERANDNPAGVVRLIKGILDISGISSLRLAVAERDRPSVAWHSDITFYQASLVDM